MSYDTELSAAQREALAQELTDLGWPNAAADIRDGLSPETVLSRLYDIGEDAESEAVTACAAYVQ